VQPVGVLSTLDIAALVAEVPRRDPLKAPTAV
jgi:hypothetical protein